MDDISWLELPTFDLSLELVKFDPTANAPEHDSGAEAPEFDHRSYAPQETTCGEGPELAFDRSDPMSITPTPSGETEKESSEDDHVAPTLCGLSRKTVRISCFVVCTCFIAIALGAGVGAGVTNRAGNPQSTGHTQPTNFSTPMKGILEDSSFAAVSTSEGNRHVFFQDQNGTLREAEYRHLTSSWSASTSSVVATNARKLTPLFACTQHYKRDNIYVIYLFYILANNTLGVKAFVPGSGPGWSDQGSISKMDLTTFIAAEDSRSLSVTVLPGTPTLDVCVFYEGLDHNITALHGRYISNYPNLAMDNYPSNLGSWVWKDLTDSLMPRYTNSQSELATGLGLSYLPNATFGAPFTSGMVRGGYYNKYGSNLSLPPPNSSFLLVMFTYKTLDKVYIMYSHYVNGTFSAGQVFLRETIYSNPNDYEFRQIINSDIVMSNVDSAASDQLGPYTFWANDTTLSFDLNNGMPTFPSSPFPYARMAVTNPPNSTALYLYHQINSTTIAEDIWDDADSSWFSSNVSVATLLGFGDAF